MGNTRAFKVLRKSGNRYNGNQKIEHTEKEASMIRI